MEKRAQPPFPFEIGTQFVKKQSFFDKLKPQRSCGQPVEKGHRKVAFFSYRGRKCGIMVWGDKNVGEECRKSRAA